VREKAPVEKHCHFVHRPTLFADKIETPTDMKKSHALIDVRLGDKSEAIDRGVVLYNINDAFKGKAPDLGAYEHGDPARAYGPRK
jgi:hypothetical protein